MSPGPITDAAAPQRSEAWYRARLGKVTGSRVAEATARTKSGWGAAREVYMVELMTERLTGIPMDSFRSAAMQWGVDMEPQARAAYAFHTDVDVVEVGFAAHPVLAMAGCSPDGLIGSEGMLQIKCPNPRTHMNTLLTGEIDPDYIKQMQWEMACTGRVWSDFVSYDPRLPAPYSMFIQRVERNPEFIGAQEADVATFIAELDAKLATLAARFPGYAEAA